MGEDEDEEGGEMNVPSYLKVWLRDALWHAEVQGWICVIHEGVPEHPYLYNAVSATEGQGGPAQSFEEARKEIDGILARKGLRVPRKQKAIPVVGIPGSVTVDFKRMTQEEGERYPGTKIVPDSEKEES